MQLPVSALVVLALLTIGAAVCSPARSQTQSAPMQTSSVSGKVTIKGKAAAGIVVGMRLTRPQETSGTYKARTDQDGIYHLTKVAPGSYLVSPVAPGLVTSDAGGNTMGQSVIVGDGESVEGINFDLVPGGVITGKVTNSEGGPLIEQRITLMPADQSNRNGPFINNGTTTDDRGDYRIFGLPAGRYKVSVGDPRLGGSPNRRQISMQTFYPDVIDPNKAGIVEVAEGSEASKIDITVSEAPQGYSVSGRVIDGETSTPLANVAIILSRIEIVDSSGTRSYGQYLDVRSDTQGQFKVTNVLPGKYDININPPEDSDVRAEGPVRFDLVDQDLSDLVIKTGKGATIAGTIVLEAGKNNPVQAPSQMWVMVYTHSEQGNNSFSSNRSVRVKPDGTFFAGGLTAGIVNLSVDSPMSNRALTLSRVERDGVVQPNGFQINNGEHINGVRLIMTVGNSAIRGTVRVENGTLPPNARMFVQIVKEGDANPLARGAQLDARGHFLIEGLTAGSYEVRAQVYVPEWRRPPTSVKQIVTVTEGGTAEVSLTVTLTPPPNQ